MHKQKTTHTSSIDTETREPASIVELPVDEAAQKKSVRVSERKGSVKPDTSKAKTATTGSRQAPKAAKPATGSSMTVDKAGRVQSRKQAKAPPRVGTESQVSKAARPAVKQAPAKGKKPVAQQPLPQAAASEEAIEAEHPKVLEAVVTTEPEAPPTLNVVALPPSITVRDLARMLKASPIAIIRELMKNGVMANINQEIDFDTAAIVASDLGFEVKEERPPEPVEELPQEPVRKRREYTAEELAKLVPRPPVVTIMGHVDHGKTSLLDVIRQSNVVAREVGGITQHIGAYQVEVQGKKITFLDTPGHEAFTAMRARGAMVTDIAVLVVAADDGVQPQTIEAIDHARAAQVPIIVALNKIDKPNANPDVVKRQLSDVGLLVEDYGGEVICVPVSAKQKIGLETLLEMILLVAEMADLKANPEAPASGTVIEGRLDKAKGPLATLLVQEGTLHLGDALVIGDLAGKVRAMFNDKGQRIEDAPPASPVVVLGLSDVPNAGEPFRVVKDEHEARALAAAEAARRQQAAEQQKRRGLSLDEFFAKAQAGQAKELNLILKADVQGSIEPIVNSVEKLGDELLKVRFLHTGTGNINESDIMLAVASQAIVIGFNVQVDGAASRMAESEGVDIRVYNIIYHLVDDIDRALKGLLEPSYKDVTIGHAEVRAIFRIGHKKQVAGCQVMDGIAARNAMVRVHRAGTVIFNGQVASLRRFKEDVREVNAGLECGVGVEGFDDFAIGDILEFYRKEQVESIAS